jgi:hypothetical protein
MRALLLIITFSFVSAVCSEAQSLGDIARKERARQQAVQTRITVTNESVNYSVPVTVPETESSENQLRSAEQPPVIVRQAPVIPVLIEEPSLPEIEPPMQLSLLEEEPPAIAPPVPPARDERWWRGAFQEAHASLKKAEDQVIFLQVALNRARLDQLETAPAKQRTGLAAEIVRLTNELNAAQNDVANARRGISELEEDLRQSGGLPSWTQ